MSNERQIIEEMARDICNLTVSCEECVMLAHKTGQSKEQYCKAMRYAERAYSADYRKQSEGEWRPWGEMFYCSQCNKYESYKSNFCPNCGAKMKDGEAKIVKCNKCRYSALTSTDGKLNCFKKNKIVKREDYCNYGEPKLKGGAE